MSFVLYLFIGMELQTEAVPVHFAWALGLYSDYILPP